MALNSNFDNNLPGNLTKYRHYAMGGTNTALVSLSTGLSIIGSFIIIITFLAWKDIRTTSRRILVFLSVADLLTALGNVIGLYIAPPKDENAIDYPCLIQSFLTSYSLIASCLWSTVMAIYLYMCLVSNSRTSADKLMPLFHVICWGIGLVVNIVAVSFGKLGNSADALTGGWCWIKVGDKYHDNKMQLLLWTIIDGKLWECICYVTIFVLYVQIKFHLKRELQQTNVKGQPMMSNVIQTAKIADRKLVLIPLLLVFIRIWGTIRFFLFMLNDLNEDPNVSLSSADKVLLSLQGIGDNAQGFVNCLLFCAWTPKVRNHISTALRTFCCDIEARRGRKRCRTHIRDGCLCHNASLKIAAAPLPGDERTPLLYPNCPTYDNDMVVSPKYV